mmetsp:Transcript_5719/g.13682  ORF Transcript_5719/g.13682 Transcript_5719/m.13682 type:complete len:200 (+) Transcript_5719:4083-4682(+)
MEAYRATPKTKVPKKGWSIHKRRLEKLPALGSRTQVPMAARFARSGNPRTNCTKMLSMMSNKNRLVPAELPRSQSSIGKSLSLNSRLTSVMKSDTIPSYFNRKSGSNKAGIQSTVEASASSNKTTRFKKDRPPDSGGESKVSVDTARALVGVSAFSSCNKGVSNSDRASSVVSHAFPYLIPVNSWSARTCQELVVLSPE